MSQSPAGGSPQSSGANPGPQTAEAIFGQILQQMQTGMGQMAQDSNRRFELLEAAIREQATVGRASAEAQVKALEAMTKKSNVVDVKGVGKPETLKGSHEDARKVWKTWSYKFESWFSSQFPAKGQECLDWARNKGDETILESAITTYANTCPEVVDVDRQLHVALISLTAEMPYTVVFNARKRCGLDAWRRLCHAYEPHNARSNMRLLRRILVQPRATLEQLRAAIDKWEADLAEYVQRGNRDLDDPQKVTILLSMVPEQLEDHLEMNIGRLDTYAKARAEVISYTEQKAAKIDDGGAAPMDLDAFKGNKGGKGKGGKAKRRTTTRTRMWSATCARRKATAKTLAGTPKRMAALANLLSPRSPRQEPRAPRARKEEKAKVARAKERPTPSKVKEKRSKSGQPRLPVCAGAEC